MISHTLPPAAPPELGFFFLCLIFLDLARDIPLNCPGGAHALRLHRRERGAARCRSGPWCRHIFAHNCRLFLLHHLIFAPCDKVDLVIPDVPGLLQTTEWFQHKAS